MATATSLGKIKPILADRCTYVDSERCIYRLLQAHRRYGNGIAPTNLMVAT